MPAPPNRPAIPPLRLIAALALLPLLLIVTAARAQDPGAGPDTWFEVDRLNAGLPAAPDWLDRSTPQGAIETFLTMADDGQYDMAAHLLDMTSIPARDQAQKGPELAMMLRTVMDRRMVLDWYALPDTPDGMDPAPASEDPFAGQPRRSLRLWIVDLDNRPVSIRLDRVKPSDGDPVWVFSRQAVGNIRAMYHLYGPTALEQALPDALKERGLWGLMIWEMIGLPLLIALAVLAGWALHRLLTVMARSNTSELGEAILRSMRRPLILFVVTFAIGTLTERLFVFSGRISTVTGPLIIIGYVMATLMLLVNVVDALLDRLVVKQDEDLSSREQEARRGLATQVAAWRRALIVVIFLAGTGFVLTSANVFRTLGFSLIGAAGVITVVLGFAGRDVLSNVLSSMQIALNQSARIGDTILFRDYFCVVERINFTYVQLRVWDRTRLVVPVREFVSEPFENWTMMTPELHRVIKLRLSHATDIEALREMFYRVALDCDAGDMADDTEPLAVRVAEQDVFGLEVWCILPCNDANTAWTFSCRVREAMIHELAARDAGAEGPAWLPEVPAAQAVTATPA